ncbi:MAG: M23 family metallopeptidase [Rubrobacteraceae bacterium]
MLEAKRKPESTQPERRRGGLFPFLLLLAIAGALLLTQNYETFFEREPGPTVFPLPERYSDSYANDWGVPRPQGPHEGTDVYAPEGTPIYSITSGTITNAYGSNEGGWNTLGGYTVMVEADRDSGPVRRGDRLYYAHMNAPTPLEDGTRVEAGDRIGTVGRTSGETEGTIADFPPHLHLGWYGGMSIFGEEREYETAPSGSINPYPLLRRTERQSAQAS